MKCFICLCCTLLLGCGKPAQFDGTVFDRKGNTRSNVEVRLNYSRTNSNSADGAYEIKTDENGVFIFRVRVRDHKRQVSIVVSGSDGHSLTPDGRAIGPTTVPSSGQSNIILKLQ